MCGNNQTELSIAGSYTGSRCSVVCHSPHPPSCVISKSLSLCDLPVLIWICQPLYWTFVSLVHKSPWGKTVKSPSEWGDLKGGSNWDFRISFRYQYSEIANVIFLFYAFIWIGSGNTGLGMTKRDYQWKKKDEVINLTLWIFLIVTIKLHSENKLWSEVATCRWWEKKLLVGLL